MLLRYCFSTGNSIVKRALKAMTFIVCIFYTLVAVNAVGISRQSLSLGSHDMVSQSKTGQRGKTSYTVTQQQPVITKCVSQYCRWSLRKQFFRSHISYGLKGTTWPMGDGLVVKSTGHKILMI